jgi:hypothetical protein
MYGARLSIKYGARDKKYGARHSKYGARLNKYGARLSKYGARDNFGKNYFYNVLSQPPYIETGVFAMFNHCFLLPLQFSILTVPAVSRHIEYQSADKAICYAPVRKKKTCCLIGIMKMTQGFA